MKQKISIILLVVFVIGTFVIYMAGSFIRNLLTPTVEVAQVDLSKINDMVCYAVPKKLTFADEELYYVYIIERDDKFSEPSYIAVRKYLNVIEIDEENIYVEYRDFLNNEKIIVPKAMQIHEKMPVKYRNN